MKRLYVVNVPDEKPKYFRTFKNVLIFFKKDVEKYSTFYRKLEYHNFENVDFDFGFVSRNNFEDGK